MLNIAVLLSSHNETQMTLDCLEAINLYVSQKVLLLVDGASWLSWGDKLQVNVPKLCGFVHAYPKAPYRNLTYGLQVLLELYPDQDWYCYAERDVLFISSNFQYDLEVMDKDVYCIGNDYNLEEFQLPYFDEIVGSKVRAYDYLLGCCVFYKGSFLRKLKADGFFEKFLLKTSLLTKDFFPDYKRYDFGEHLYPTLASLYGGKNYCWGRWSMALSQWGGNFQKYTMRFRPEITWKDITTKSSILHPVKENNAIREFFKLKRSRLLSKCL